MADGESGERHRGLVSIAMPGKTADFQVWKTAKPDVFLHDGKNVTPPPGWAFVPSGDPGLTRRLKSSGECWVVVHRRKNRVESLGLLTDGTRVAQTKAQLATERADPSYLRKLDSAKKRREAEQAKYEVEFREAVLKFLAFAPRHAEMALKLAGAVTVLAAPVGSGTVARTERIPLERRAEAAVIAWMRHQTTAYDHMSIARIKGERREVRRDLAERSRRLLEKYRNGEPVDSAVCPLAGALK
ncbi:MAG: DUF2293 domain-containing protein [Victivallaceae bacterium]|nr:DUF2293 domain-containing protein [Victivallaceae bacterium]